MSDFVKAVNNKRTTITGVIILIGMALKLFLPPGNETVIDELVGSLDKIVTNLIGIGTGIGLILAKDGATGSAPGTTPSA